MTRHPAAMAILALLVGAPHLGAEPTPGAEPAATPAPESPATPVATPAPAPSSAAPAEPEPGWTIVHEVEGIKVFQRISPNPDLKEFKAVVVLDMPASELSAVMKDKAKYTQFFPYLVENKHIEKDGKHYSYERISAPLIAERDYTVEQVDEDLPLGGWRMTFHEANDVGPPPNEGKVRIQVVQGKWELLPQGDGKTQVTYHVYTDPGGSIPNVIINAANKKGVSKAVLALRDRVIALRKPDTGR